MNKTTLQIPMDVRDALKQAASARAEHMGISKLSMVDYLRLLLKEQPL